MKQDGFVYVLTNPSLEGCVKIGKTIRDCESRAAELSAASGVPTPFSVAYEARFADCNAAEQFVHTLLETEGFRLSANREFFRVPLKVAVQAVVLAEQEFAGYALNESFRGVHTDDLLDAALGLQGGGGGGNDVRNDARGRPVWMDLLEAAERADQGLEGELQDEGLALQLYEQAARLGAPYLHERIATLYASKGNTDKALQVLKDGMSGGSALCAFTLAQVFTGTSVWFGNRYTHSANARLCYRKYFQMVDETSPIVESQIYGALKAYTELLRSSQSSSNEEDWDTIRDFIERFLKALRRTNRPADLAAKEGDLRKLLEPAMKRTS